MTRWRSIVPGGPPYDLQPDEVGRARLAFNIECVKRASPPGILAVDELIFLLSSQGFGTYGTSIFKGSKADYSAISMDLTFLTVIETGGARSEGTHNDGLGAYRKPSFLLVFRSTNYDDAALLANNVQEFLIDFHDRDISIP